jgi:hypothetical protein
MQSVVLHVRKRYRWWLTILHVNNDDLRGLVIKNQSEGQVGLDLLYNARRSKG